MKIIYILLVALFIGVAVADVYLAMEGSNNRLNENTATRANNNRLFDSQNNNRGGRNVGEYTTAKTTSTDIAQLPNVGYNFNQADAAQYPYTFFEGSYLTVVWTNQHGCGGNPANDPHNLNCQLVLQYACETNNSDPAMEFVPSNGSITDSPQPADNFADIAAKKASNAAQGRGRHESEQYYFECQNRKRNGGLFVADQQLAAQTSIHTRQNPGGNRSGLECAEERDYWPPLSPSPWRDIAYLTSEHVNTNVQACNMATTLSQNVRSVYKCNLPAAKRDNTNAPITEDECTAEGGEWKGYTHGIDAPYCGPAPWSRDNHLGNSREGHWTNYTWVLPKFDDLWTGTGESKPSGVNAVAKCVFRLRYNITTGDYDPWNTFDGTQGVENIKNNPTVTLGIDPQGLKLAFNTAQTGRTFQDRSHIFTIRRRPASIASNKITNVMVVGKRGNIVQSYPNWEYWWMPHVLYVDVGEIAHIQWTGSNTHNNGGNGGDGQTGDDGQGDGGTDRNNFVATPSEGANWPIPLDLDAAGPQHAIWHYVDCWRVTGTGSDANALASQEWKNCAMIMATSGYYTSMDIDGTLNVQMNNARPSLIGGVLLRFKDTARGKKFTYMSSRNNNFTNRSQKGLIVVRN